MRYKVVEWLEDKWIKTSSRIVEDKEEIIKLLGEKLVEEMKELEKEMKEANIDNMLKEAWDVNEIIDRLFILLKEYDIDKIDWYNSIINTMSAAQEKIHSEVTQKNQELIGRMKDFQIQKRDEKWWFEKWIFLISTDW